MSGTIALLIVLNPRAWRLARTSITIAHEGGHALASVFTDRRLGGICLHSDTSGVTYSRGRRTGPAVVLTSAAGNNLAPSLLGAEAAWLLAAHHVIAMLWLLLALLAAMFLAFRNAYGVLAVLVSVGAVLAVDLVRRDPGSVWLRCRVVPAAWRVRAAPWPGGHLGC